MTGETTATATRQIEWSAAKGLLLFDVSCLFVQSNKGDRGYRCVSVGSRAMVSDAQDEECRVAAQAISAMPATHEGSVRA